MLLQSRVSSDHVFGSTRSTPRAKLPLVPRAQLDAAIEVSKLSHRYGDREILKGVDLSVQRGTLHAVVGANGCGKSTLLKILGRLVPAQAGHINVAAPVGIVLQNPDHQIVLPTVSAEVAFGLGRFKLQPRHVEQLVRDALESVGLLDLADAPTNILSGGQRQRIAIAGALVQRPKVLLLDELTTFLDEAGQRSVLEAVRRLVDGPRRVTALWITHRLEELQWADAVSMMQDGNVVLTSSPKQVMRRIRRSS